jgi:hypothetical protein
MDGMGKERKGRPLAVDHNATSASRTEPAFIARPAGAPVYHGFQVLEDVTVEGFAFGKITDFEAERIRSRTRQQSRGPGLGDC